MLRMLLEKYSQKNKKLYHIFVDLENIFYRVLSVPSKVVRL